MSNATRIRGLKGLLVGMPKGLRIEMSRVRAALASGPKVQEPLHSRKPGTAVKEKKS